MPLPPERYTSEIQPIRPKKRETTKAITWAVGSSSKTEGKWDKFTHRAQQSPFDELFDFQNNQHAPF